MKLTQPIAIALLTALAACSQGAGTVPSTSSTASLPSQASTIAASPKSNSHERKPHGCRGIGCGWAASTLFTMSNVVTSNGVTYNASQTLQTYSAQTNGNATELLGYSFQEPSPPTVSQIAKDQIFIDPSGYVWSIGVYAGSNHLMRCLPSGVNGSQCTPEERPTNDITNPQAIAVGRNGALAVLNGDGTIAVFSPGFNQDSTPLVIAADNSAILNDAPTYMSFDSAGDLWIEDANGGRAINGNPQGRLVEFAPGVSGAHPALKEVLGAFGGVEPACPFTVNSSNQIWMACDNASGVEYIQNISATTGDTTTQFYGLPVGVVAQVTADDFDVYFSDTLNNRVAVYANTATTNVFARMIYGLGFPGGIALQ